MPILDWIGKSKVVNHHLDVPYCVLDRKYSYDETGYHEEDIGSENMIIHGDNLLALKSLLPQYENGIDCIYIDPPYNTAHSTNRNQLWVYNDNVDDPRLLKWLGEVVGDEGEDLSRHDKWLCMMYPRLKLLHRLLSANGVIFISIDENEQVALKALCNEIFGLNCFVASISWQKTYSPRNNNNGIATEVEYVLVYSKMPGWIANRLPRTKSMNDKYKNPDNDTVPWKTSDASAPGAISHQGMVYAIQNPITGELLYPPMGRCWSREQNIIFESMQKWAKYKLEDLHNDKQRAEICGIDEENIRKGVCSIVLDEPLEESRKKAQKLVQEGPWPLFYFTNKGKGGLSKKTYLDKVQDRTPTNFWPFVEVGHTDEATKELKNIFGGSSPFDTPKPVRLIERIIQIATNENSIILDSFAGSGTTAHAVLKANAYGGNRRFILIEMMDYAERITAERVKRVITGYSKDEESVLFDEKITTKNLSKGAELLDKAMETFMEAKDSGIYDSVEKPKIKDGHLCVVATKKAKAQEPGIPGNFSYYELGERLMKEGMLNEHVSTVKIREYVYFTETKQKLLSQSSDEPYLLGQHAGNAYYFFYQKNNLTTLDREFLHTIKTKAEGYVIYADLCTLSDRELERYHITFKKIPRDISKL